METKALVLGGGGVTGIAWSLGLLAGWAEQGLNVADADLVVGTSAGAVVAAQLTTGCDPQELYAEQLAGPGNESAVSLNWRRLLPMAPLMLRAPHSARARARIGKLALQTPTVPEQQRRDIIASRLPVHAWPDRDLRITAVNTASGKFHPFQRADDVALVDAVAASCAVPGVWPPMTVSGQRWMDGGVRSATNLDLAQGYDRVLLLAPMSYGTAEPLRNLRRSAQVVAIAPDPAARKEFGRNPLDPAQRPPAAHAGHTQAAVTRESAAELWFQP